MFPAALACLLLAAAPDPTVYIEFDGKAGKNPTCPAAGTITATGTFTLPPDSDFIEVEVRVPLQYEGPALKSRILIADVDRSVKPHKWTVRGENFEPKHYLLFAILHFESKTGKGGWETWDHRKVIVTAPDKK